MLDQIAIIAPQIDALYAAPAVPLVIKGIRMVRGQIWICKLLPWMGICQ